jgi:hypothetical protein
MLRKAINFVKSWKLVHCTSSLPWKPTVLTSTFSGNIGATRFYAKMTRKRGALPAIEKRFYTHFSDS